MKKLKSLTLRLRQQARGNAGSLQGIVALMAISAGLWMIYPPSALIVAGALILLDKVL